MLRKFSIILALWMILTCATGCFSSTYTLSSNANTAVLEVGRQLSLTSELVNCYVKDDLLRIEQIQPGLDAFELTVTLYSLSKDRVLGELKLGEGDWFSDWTQTGFYVLSPSQKELRAFDTACQPTQTISLPDQFGHLSFIMADDQLNTFFLGDGETGKLHLYDRATDTAKDVGQMLFGYQNPIAFKDDYFYLEGETDLLRMPKGGDYAETAFCNKQRTDKFVDLCIGTDEGFFSVFLPEQDGHRQIPMQEHGETVLSAGGKYFATTNGKRVMIYDVQQNTVQKHDFEQHVSGAVFYADRLLVSTYDHSCHHLYSLSLGAASTSPISTNTTTNTTQPVGGTTNDRGDPITTTPPEETQTTAPSTQTAPGKHVIDGVPVIPQKPDYPTGCETVSAVMALRYWGEDVDVDQFIDEFLPKSAYFYNKNGVYCGPSPYEYFIGDPRSENAFGCMAPVIEKALVNYFGSGERVVNTTGTSLAALCDTYVSQNVPVLVWVTIAMIDTYKTASWQLDDGTTFEWPANEHCMVLIGYDEENYYFNDPYSGKRISYPKSLCEKRYSQLGMQSIVITD